MVPNTSKLLQDLKMNFDHHKLTGERTVQNAITEVAAMMGENVKLGGGFTISAPSHGVLSTYLHTSSQPGNKNLKISGNGHVQNLHAVYFSYTYEEPLNAPYSKAINMVHAFNWKFRYRAYCWTFIA